MRTHDETLRPFVDEVQAEAVRTGLETLVPRTAAARRRTGVDRVQLGWTESTEDHGVPAKAGTE